MMHEQNVPHVLMILIAMLMHDNVAKYCLSILPVPSLRGMVVWFHFLPFWTLGCLDHLTLPVSFGRDTKSRQCLLSAVCPRGSKRSHLGINGRECWSLSASASASLTIPTGSCSSWPELLPVRAYDRRELYTLYYCIHRVQCDCIDSTFHVCNHTL